MAQPQSKAVWALVLGILAVLCCCGCFTGIPACIVGKLELDAISRGELPEDGKTMAIIGIVFGALGIIGFIGLVILQMMTSALDGVLRGLPGGGF